MKFKAKVANKNMADYLKNLRRERNYTMRVVAEKINMPHSFIGKTEQLTRRMDVGEFVHYCYALDQDPIAALKDIMALQQDIE
ncbi:MAG: transcriptional regulator with XRE-family HTH domain [Phenylobacterium sp.]|jgi:transcriptional regulator with XRE-family HTH domain